MSQVVITGGSRGIGAAAVRRFSALGHRVFFFYRNHTQEAQRICQETGAIAFQVDVTDTTAVQNAFSQIGSVDILILNAGQAHYGLISQISEEQWLHLFDVNVHGMYRCIQAALPSMLAVHNGCILTVSSMWGQVGASCEVAYSATKGAVIAMTKGLAKELGPSGIRVNAVAPGVILTDMVKDLGEETLQDLAEQTPLERLGTPDDVAQALVYLSQAQFLTGQVLGINGGFVI